MKLHLPKLLLTAVLAAMAFVPGAWGANQVLISDTTWDANNTTTAGTSDRIFVGEAGNDVYDIVLTINEGANITADWLVLRRGGDVEMNGGTVTLNRLHIHNHNGTPARTEVFTQHGGTVNVNATDNFSAPGTGERAAVTIGHWGNGGGELIVDGGTFNALQGSIYMGHDSPAELSISGTGVVNTVGLYYNPDKDIASELELDGGRLNLGADGRGGIQNTRTGAAGSRKVSLLSGTLGTLTKDGWTLSGVTTTVGNITIDTNVWDAATGATATGDAAGSANISLLGNLTAAADGMTITLEGAGSLTIDHTLHGSVNLAEGSSAKVLVNTSDVSGFDHVYSGVGSTGASGFLVGRQIYTSGNVEVYNADGSKLISSNGVYMYDTPLTEFYVWDVVNRADVKGEVSKFIVNTGGQLNITGNIIDAPIENSARVNINAGASAVTLSSVFGSNAITQKGSGIVSISTTGAVSSNSSSDLNIGGTLEINGAASFTNDNIRLELNKLILQDVTNATITGSQSSSAGRVSGEIQVLGNGKLVLTGSHDLLGWSNADYTDKILLRGTDAKHVATLQLDTRQTCSTALVLEGNTRVLNGGSTSVDTGLSDWAVSSNNNVGVLHLHTGGSITASGNNNVFSAVLLVKANSTVTVNNGGSLLMDNIVYGGSTLTKAGAGSLTLSGKVGTADNKLGNIVVSGGLLELQNTSFLSDITLNGNSQLKFSGEGVTHTAGQIKTDGAAGKLTVAGGTTLSAASLTNSWGISNGIEVNGALNVTGTDVGLRLAYDQSPQRVFGTGSIDAAKFVLANNGTYDVSVNSLHVGSGGLAVGEDTYSILNLSCVTTTVDGTTSVVGDASALNFVSGDVTLNGAVSNAAAINVNGGTVTMNGGISGSGTLALNGGSLVFAAASDAVSNTIADFHYSGGSLTHSGLVVTDATISRGTLDNSGNNDGTLTLNGILTLAEPGYLTPTGTVKYSGGASSENGFYSGDYLVISGGNIQLGTGFKVAGTGVTGHSMGANGLVVSVADNSTFVVNSGSETASSTIESVEGFTHYHVNSKGTLVASGSNLSSLLTNNKTTGDGTIQLGENATIGVPHNSTFTTTFEGTLEVMAGTLSIYPSSNGNAPNQTHSTFDFRSLESLKLNGGNLSLKYNQLQLKKMYVAADATISIDDMWGNKYSDKSTVSSFGIVELDKNLTLSTNWKSGVHIGLLTGSGSLKAEQTNGSESNKSKLWVDGVEDFTGSITLSGKMDLMLNLAQDQIFKQTQLSIGSGSSATLTGSGVYDMTGDNNFANTSVADGWSGTVLVSGVDHNRDTDIGLTLAAMGNSNSKIKLHGVSEHLIAGTYNAEIELADSGINAALKVIDGGSGSEYKFAGGVTGNGNFIIDTTGSTVTGMKFIFSGDVSNWKNGASLVATLSNLNEVTFSGDATEINAKLGTTKGKLTVNIDNAADVSVNGVISKDAADFSGWAGAGEGTLNLNVKGGGEATFGNKVHVTKLAVGETSSAKIGGASNQITAGNVSISRQNATLSNVTVEGNSITKTGGTAGSIANAEVSLAELAAGSSYTIADMTLSNVTVTAATSGTAVNLTNVTAEAVQLEKGSYTMTDVAKVGEYSVEGSTASFTTNLLSGITLNNADSSASLVVDLGDLGSLAGLVYDKTYKLTITLSGFTMDDEADPSLLFAADSWLGQQLAGQGAAKYVSGSLETSAELASNTTVTVQYTGMTGESGANVGTIITITGLTVVPEPASATLSLAALMMLCARRRRRA